MSTILPKLTKTSVTLPAFTSGNPVFAAPRSLPWLAPRHLALPYNSTPAITSQRELPLFRCLCPFSQHVEIRTRYYSIIFLFTCYLSLFNCEYFHGILLSQLWLPVSRCHGAFRCHIAHCLRHQVCIRCAFAWMNTQ